MRVPFVILCLVAVPLFAIPPQENGKSAGVLVIQIDGFKTFEGFLRLALFNREEVFPSKTEESFRHISVPIQSKVETVRLENIPWGTYAVSVHHDINGNRRLEKTFLGIPKEPVAVSNNPAIRFGPPKFNQAKFQFTSAEMTIAVHLPQSVLNVNKDLP